MFTVLHHLFESVCLSCFPSVLVLPCFALSLYPFLPSSISSFLLFCCVSFLPFALPPVSCSLSFPLSPFVLFLLAPCLLKARQGGARQGDARQGRKRNDARQVEATQHRARQRLSTNFASSIVRARVCRATTATTYPEQFGANRWNFAITSFVTCTTT